MLQSQEERGLSHLIGKWMSGPALQRAMLNTGINIFVNEYTDRYVSTCGKVCFFRLLAFRVEQEQDDTRFEPGIHFLPSIILKST